MSIESPARSRIRRIATAISGGVLVAALVAIASCLGSAVEPRTEEIAFDSGPFKVVGDLRLPAGRGPHPVVVFVHGDGPNSRTAGGTYPPIMERMASAGYATFAWDKPGTGESTGEIDRSRLGEQRAGIVLDAVQMLKARPDIDPRQIGLWGISQAGYVMPRVLLASDDVAFMIAVSCPGVAGADQGAYLVAAQAACNGMAEGDAEQLRQLLSAIERVDTYHEYVEYKASLDALPGMDSTTTFGYRPGILPESEWHRHDPNHEYFWNPIVVIEQTTIPVLAFYGALDTQVDPVESARAYEEALRRVGNPNFRIEIIPGTDHNIILSETGCLDEQKSRPRYKWTNYAPEYLDALEEWLRALRRGPD